MVRKMIRSVSGCGNTSIGEIREYDDYFEQLGVCVSDDGNYCHIGFNRIKIDRFNVNVCQYLELYAKDVTPKDIADHLRKAQAIINEFISKFDNQ